MIVSYIKILTGLLYKAGHHADVRLRNYGVDGMELGPHLPCAPGLR